MASATVLIATVDDRVAHDIAGMLADAGHVARRAFTRQELEQSLRAAAHDLVITDLDMNGGPVDALLSDGASQGPDVAVVALVAPEDVARGVAAVRAGARDYLQKPVDRDELFYVVEKTLSETEVESDAPPRSMLSPPQTRMIGSSQVVRELFDTVRRAADGVATVLVRGESGSGKEVIARLIHELSPRRAGPFIKVHCAALPDNLLESELFGYERGAFTGAVSRKAGRVELSQGGTLFLDEIGDITPAFQVKLLRLLQDRQYERLGGTETLDADVRFVAATHRDLEAMVREGSFREDLFYRLNVVSIWAPPLRARPDDIEPLALHFCTEVARANGRAGVQLDVDALGLLRSQPWPGNVRQLQNFVERLVVMSRGPRISVADVQRELSRGQGTIGFAEATGLAPQVSMESSVIDLSEALRRAERKAIEKALRRAKGNRNLAARLLGISRRSLYYKLQEHGLS